MLLLQSIIEEIMDRLLYKLWGGVICTYEHFQLFHDYQTYSEGNLDGYNMY